MTDFYSDSIIDHYRNPRNFGHLAEPDTSAEDANLLCGDDIRVELAIDSERKVRQVRFSGKGCAISQASMSMLTEEVKGKTLDEIAAIPKETVLEKIGIAIGSTRIRCALLGLAVLKSAAICEFD